VLGAGLRHGTPREHQTDKSDRDVDEEDGAPPQAGHVRGDKYAAEQLTDDHGQSGRRAVPADRT
jgi:hypothetical protein